MCWAGSKKSGWIEVQSPHFIVDSNSGKVQAKAAALQLEQIRNALERVLVGARSAGESPSTILAVDGEGSLKRLLPGYFEKRGVARQGMALNRDGTAMNNDLLKPISGPNPSGKDLRYNVDDPVYYQIKQARLGEDLRSVASDRERMTADYGLVVELATEAIAKKSKDLEITGWLTEAWVKLRGFSGLLDGLELFHGLVSNFWETVYPAIEEDGDVERRVGRLEWLNGTLDVPLRSVPLVEAEYGLDTV
ncbi:MAG: ImpA family type VI secretion system protein [Terriglobia bacterium]